MKPEKAWVIVDSNGLMLWWTDLVTRTRAELRELQRQYDFLAGSRIARVEIREVTKKRKAER